MTETEITYSIELEHRDGWLPMLRGIPEGDATLPRVADEIYDEHRRAHAVRIVKVTTTREVTVVREAEPADVRPSTFEARIASLGSTPAERVEALQVDEGRALLRRLAIEAEQTGDTALEVLDRSGRDLLAVERHRATVGSPAFEPALEFYSFPEVGGWYAVSGVDEHALLTAPMNFDGSFDPDEVCDVAWSQIDETDAYECQIIRGVLQMFASTPRQERGEA